MSRFAQIDLSELPPPDVVEEIDFETILEGAVTELAGKVPDLAGTIALESDPLRKNLEVMSYMAMLLRARVNDASQAVMLATATGADLENLSALFGVQRLVIVPADEETVPPTPAVMEADDDLRRRTQLALEGFTTAGSRGAYEFHARSADGRVADVSVTSPSPGEVLVTVLANTGDGTPPADLIEAVGLAVNADEVRPLCDYVTVAAPTIIEYMVVAELEIADGPDASAVLSAAQDAVNAYVAATHAIGATVAVSGLLRALHQAGVISATLSTPAADIEASLTEAPYCTSVTITQAGA
jgi:Phage-related baseplate assembly protein